jgi:hypothetical protein
MAAVIFVKTSTCSAVTRNDICSNANQYLIVWSPLVDTARIYDATGTWIEPTYSSCFTISDTTIGEAYVNGGTNDFISFIDKMCNQVCPGGYNTSNYGKRADGTTNASYYLGGIDCAAFVNRCLDLNSGQGIPGLQTQCMSISQNNIKRGDILTAPPSGPDNRSHHVVLVGEWGGNYANIGVWESTPPQIRSGPRNCQAYTPYSIFPQFSAMTPEPDSTIKIGNKPLTISVKAEGSKSIENVLMWLDGSAVTPSVKGKKTSKTISHKPSNLSPGKHRVKVQCANVVNGIAYEDTVAWEFRYGNPQWSECTDNINGTKAYYLVYGNYSTYTVYDWYEAPISWSWVGKIKEARELTALHFAGNFGDSPFWITNNGDTTGLLSGISEPPIYPISTGGYSISVNGTAVATFMGQHVYEANSLGNYYNRIDYPVTRLYNLAIENPSEVKIGFTPPNWPSQVDVGGGNTWNYLGSNCWVFSLGSGKPQMVAKAEDGIDIFYGGRLKNSGDPESDPEISPKEAWTSAGFKQFCKAYPNPAKDRINMKLSIEFAGNIELKIYNVSGQLVKTLIDGFLPAGIQALNWNGVDNDGKRVRSGVYFYKLIVGDKTETYKFIWLK